MVVDKIVFIARCNANWVSTLLLLRGRNEMPSKIGECEAKDGLLGGGDLVFEILKNTHSSLKWVWQILMGLALANAIRVFSFAINPALIENPLDILGAFYCESSLVFFSFSLIFIRIFFGDSRYLDLNYLETQYHYGLKAELGSFNTIRRFFDIVLLILNGTLVFMLSQFINETNTYISLFILLMAANIVWLMLAFIIQRESNKKEILIGGLKRNAPLLRWSINNFVFSVAVILWINHSPKGTIIAILLTIFNSFADFLVTWPFYFPDLKKICLASTPVKVSESKKMQYEMDENGSDAGAEIGGHPEVGGH